MNTAILREAVARVMPAIDSKGLVKAFTNLSFHDSQIDATDGSMLATATLPEPVPTFMIPGGLLYSLLTTITEENVELIIKDGTLVVKTKRIVGKLCLPAGIEPPKLKLDIKEWKPVPAGFIKGLFLCSHAASTDQTAGVLTGVRVDNEMVASDRFRIARYRFEKLSDTPAFVVPVDIIALIAKQSAGIDQMSIVDDTIYFSSTTKKFTMGSKLLKGAYPETLGTFLASLDRYTWFDVNLSPEVKEQINVAVDRQNLIQSEVLEFDRTTVFSYDKGAIQLFAESKLLGSIEEKLEATDRNLGTGPAFAFNINPHFLLDAFADINMLRYSKGLEVAMFVSDAFNYLVKTQK